MWYRRDVLVVTVGEDGRLFMLSFPQDVAEHCDDAGVELIPTAARMTAAVPRLLPGSRAARAMTSALIRVVNATPAWTWNASGARGAREPTCLWGDTGWRRTAGR
jgi:hypothetical protein